MALAAQRVDSITCFWPKVAAGDLTSDEAFSLYFVNDARSMPNFFSSKTLWKEGGRSGLGIGLGTGDRVAR